MTNQTVTSEQWFATTFAEVPVMAILRGMGVEHSLELAGVAWDLGIDAVEVPIQSSADCDALRAVVAAGRDRGKQVGAGTIVDDEAVRLAAEAGASFTVSPGFDLDVVHASEQAGMPSLPGVATASEVQRARREGIHWMKAFPASVLGTEWFTTIHGSFPDVNFLATGGMNARNAPDFLVSGARVVAVGSALSDPEELARLTEIIRR